MITDLTSWRIAILCIGLAGLLCSAWFWRNLPDSRHFVAQPFSLREHLRSLVQQLQDPGQLCLYGVGFLLMGSFVTLYSYLGYQLTEPPYNLSQAVIGWIFVVYLSGSLGSSVLARLADRWSRRSVLPIGIVLTGLGAVITLSTALPIKIVGVIMLTFSFFGAHAIASSWVGIRAGKSKAQGSALYLFFYYAGSSIGNTAGGFFWGAYNWPGVIGMIGVFALCALGLTLVLTRIPARNASGQRRAVESTTTVSRIVSRKLSHSVR